MASRVNRGQLIIPKGNLTIRQKKTVVDGNKKSSEMATKKGGVGLGSRKALTDITNKTTLLLHREKSSGKKDSSANEEINVAEEGFLHDHKKCIQSQQIAMNSFYLDLVLPDSESETLCPVSKQAMSDLDALPHYPDPLELLLPECFDWRESSTKLDSPPLSPIRWDSPPPSPSRFGDVEFELCPEDDALVKQLAV